MSFADFRSPHSCIPWYSTARNRAAFVLFSFFCVGNRKHRNYVHSNWKWRNALFLGTDQIRKSQAFNITDHMMPNVNFLALPWFALRRSIRFPFVILFPCRWERKNNNNSPDLYDSIQWHPRNSILRNMKIACAQHSKEMWHEIQLTCCFFSVFMYVIVYFIICLEINKKKHTHTNWIITIFFRLAAYTWNFAIKNSQLRPLSFIPFRMTI